MIRRLPVCLQEQRSIELRKAELAEARLQKQRNEEYEVRSFVVLSPRGPASICTLHMELSR